MAKVRVGENLIPKFLRSEEIICGKLFRVRAGYSNASNDIRMRTDNGYVVLSSGFHFLNSQFGTDALYELVEEEIILSN